MVSTEDGQALDDKVPLDLYALDEDQFQEVRRKIIASLSGFSRLSPATRAEIVDDAFYSVLKCGQLDPDREPLAYIKATARRLAVKVSQRQARESLTDDQPTLEQALESASLRARPREPDPSDGPVPEQGATRDPLWGPTEDEELLDGIHAAIDSIGAEQCRAVTQLRAQDIDSAEVATALGITRNQVYQQWSRGQQKVREAPEIRDRTRAGHAITQPDAHKER
ncbi:RNA polymerase sigma factor [Streptomyces hokutonensis]|uniref:RNA polymerase sigma factor n=1 Tax=Streptomyces hokutonensis TaxID=1306990 RepID=UPI00037C03DE|nr:sigma-70 family RNA polymerase sigma factor [Streptomyces hokutonensis]